MCIQFEPKVCQNMNKKQQICLDLTPHPPWYWDGTEDYFKDGCPTGSIPPGVWFKTLLSFIGIYFQMYLFASQ